jgi:hypothetical protein
MAPERALLREQSYDFKAGELRTLFDLPEWSHTQPRPLPGE